MSAVTLAPKDWRIHSRGEREVTYQGRHFFARRCNGLYWLIDEMDGPVVGSAAGARQIDRPMVNIDTRDLSAAVMLLAGAPARPNNGHLWFTRGGVTACGHCDEERDPDKPNPPCTGQPNPPGGDYMLLKWGTLKGWTIKTEPFRAALQALFDLGARSMSAIAQVDTDAQKEALCAAIDAMDGKIQSDWDGKFLPKEAAKKYVREYKL